MSTQTLNCAVCDTPLTDIKTACPVCGFLYPSVYGFGSDKSRQFWRTMVNEQKQLLEQQAREKQLHRLRQLRFEIFPSCLCMFDTRSGTMTLYSGNRPPESFPNVISCSISTRHSVFLKKNGTLISRGSNEYDQCNLSDLKNVTSVYAGSTCTYAVLADGTVAVRGYSQHEKTIASWKNIKKITGSKGRIVGLTGDGRLEIADDLRSIHLDVNDAVDVATTHNYTIWLRKDGTVGCHANPNDARGNLNDWKDIVTVGAENYYAIGLRSDGRSICTAGTSVALDMGRSSAAQWENVLAISCSPSCILGVFENGTVEIVGNVEKRDVLQEALSQALREMLISL